MQTKKVAWTIAIGFTVVIVMYFFRAFNVIQAEYDLIVRWVSTISLVITGVYVGILVSKSKIPAKTAITNMMLVIFGLALIPLLTMISATVLYPIPLSMETKILVSFVVPTSCTVVYMFYVIKYRKRKYATSWETA